MNDRSTIASVADGQIPQSPPPASESGLIGWLRQNLFSNIFSTVLTIVSILFIGYVLVGVFPWFWNSVWSAGSLQECRAVDHGACFAVIRERWLQFVFGFFPADERWRGVLAFILMFVAFWPALFSSAPRKMLIFSALYPFIAYWLTWGGSIWGPVGTLLGFAIFFAVLRYLPAILANAMDEGIAFLLSIAGAVVAAILWWLFMVIPFDGALTSIVNIGLEPVESAKLGGFMLSLIIGVSGIVASLPLGIALALGRRSNLLIIKAVSTGFIEFIRGVPLITLLFVANTMLNYFVPPGNEFDIILRVVIMVTLFSAAYMAEVIRGGLAALPRGQYEAADALGLDYWKSMRLIIMPQALKISIPGIVNTFIGLFKDTTLVSIIALLDPVGILNPIRADQNWNGIVWELYGFIALFFFIFCFSMSRYSMYLERKLQTGHR